MKLILVRHGEYNKKTGKLTKKGIKDAQLTRIAVNNISNYDPTKTRKTYTSGLVRSVETADYTGLINLNLNEYSRKEGFDKMVIRVKETIKDLERHEEDYVIIYGHATFLSTFLSYICGLEPKSKSDLIFSLDLCSITQIQYGYQKYSDTVKWVILETNNTSHL